MPTRLNLAKLIFYFSQQQQTSSTDKLGTKRDEGHFLLRVRCGGGGL